MQDCQIETQSILHAVSDGKRLRQPGVPALPSLKLVHEGQVEGEEVLSSPTRPDGAAGILIHVLFIPEGQGEITSFPYTHTSLIWAA